jgi:hypothetical protein
MFIVPIEKKLNSFAFLNFRGFLTLKGAMRGEHANLFQSEGPYNRRFATKLFQTPFNKTLRMDQSRQLHSPC